MRAEALHDKYRKLQFAIVQASQIAAAPVIEEDTLALNSVSKLQQLIDERKALSHSDTARRCQISKDIRRETRRIKEEERSAKIDTILTYFSKIRAIKAIKSRRKMDLTIGMTDIHGNLKRDRADIAEVFAKFYEELYRSRKAGRAEEPVHRVSDNCASVPPFDADDLESGLRNIKTGKAKDCKGFVAERLKVGSATFRSVLLQLMNAILDTAAPTPTEWHDSVLKIIYKGGDARLLYKLPAHLCATLVVQAFRSHAAQPTGTYTGQTADKGTGWRS